MYSGYLKFYDVEERDLLSKIPARDLHGYQANINAILFLGEIGSRAWG